MSPEDITAIAVTAGPGLIGALLVGVMYAKGLALSLGKPLIGVHHHEGHLFAPWLEDPTLEAPFVALLVSGGHTMLIDVPAWGEYHLLGETLDDAAGEAFDKVGTLLGLDYPAGAALEQLAATGNPARFRFPRPCSKTAWHFRSADSRRPSSAPFAPAPTSTMTEPTWRGDSKTPRSTSWSKKPPGPPKRSAGAEPRSSAESPATGPWPLGFGTGSAPAPRSWSPRPDSIPITPR